VGVHSRDREELGGPKMGDFDAEKTNRRGYSDEQQARGHHFRCAKSDINLPVQKLGAYIAMTCHCRSRLADSCERLQNFIASGTAVREKLISE